MENINFNQLIGKTFTYIDNKENVELIFTTQSGDIYTLYHDQDCCEEVSIDDICGDLNDLLNTPILHAEETTSDKNPENVSKEYQDSFTWTFYHIRTIKGSVTIRWYGESNGYYSESVSCGYTKGE